MTHKPRLTLGERVAQAGTAALAERKYVCAVDILIAIGWLDPGAAQRWRRGQIDCLADAFQVRPERLTEALDLIRAWSEEDGLQPAEAAYVSATPARQTLRFSQGGTQDLEARWRTHWTSAELSDKARERLTAKAKQAPELVVVQPLNSSWTCHRCGGTGDLLMMEGSGPACLRCVGLDDLEFLATGDALLTRRVKAASTRYAVVVRFSRARKRYERQGLLVEPAALAEVRRGLAKPADATGG